ncbi:MAG: hypothetical protein NHB14_24760 [Desulfosporosinus sp.]|nr:hypothetical protein [Desulfosporosinus sp.]
MNRKFLSLVVAVSLITAAFIAPAGASPTKTPTRLLSSNKFPLTMI